MEEIICRGALTRTRKAIENGKIKLGFIGGSITESTGSYRSYSEKVVDSFSTRYPDVQVTFRNAGIGATGSVIGVFRVDDALIAAECDLVFVEFAVNDWDFPHEERNAAREGLIRKLLKAGCDVAVLYTHRVEMNAYIECGEVPHSIAGFETLCEYYRLPSVWMGLHAYNAMKKGLLRYEEWLPDGLHPETTGSAFYGEAVCKWLFDALENGRDEAAAYPAEPLYTAEYEHTHALALESLQWRNPWKLRDMSLGFAFQQRLETSAVGASIDIPFTGTGLVVVQPYGRHAAAMEAWVDGEKNALYNEAPIEWEGDLGHYRVRTICRGLERGEHRVRLVNRFSQHPESIGTRLSIALVGVIE